MSRSRKNVAELPLTVYPEDERLRNIGIQIQETRRLIYDGGRVFTPDTSLKRIIGSLPSSGGVAFLSEGTWFINDGISTSRSNITLAAVVPGRTIIKRTSSTSTADMIELTGTDCRLVGLRFNDSQARASAVVLKGNRGAVVDCIADDCYNFVTISGANWCEVRGNHVISARNRGVDATGTCAHLMLDSNRFESTTAEDIYLGDSVSSTAIIGNILDYSTGNISLRGAAAGIPGIMADPEYSLGLHNLNSMNHANVTQRS